MLKTLFDQAKTKVFGFGKKVVQILAAGFIVLLLSMCGLGLIALIWSLIGPVYGILMASAFMSFCIFGPVDRMITELVTTGGVQLFKTQTA